MSFFGQVWQFLLDSFSQIWVLYTGSIILAAVPALWLLRKVVKFFRLIM